jgi:tetratricopeptide (TPR) repeat protein
VLEEQNLSEGSELTPPAAGAAEPTPPPAQMAAVPPHAPQAAPASLVPAESESLLSLIGAKTPPNTVASLRLIEDGRQQMNQGNYSQALDRFERGVTIDPTNAYGYYFLARLNYQLKKYDQASAFAGRAVALGARTDRSWQARAHSLQGAVFEQVGRYPDARRAYQKAIEADPSNVTARSGISRLGAQ